MDEQETVEKWVTAANIKLYYGVLDINILPFKKKWL